MPFSRDTLFLSIYECCKHRPNPVADAAALTGTVLAKALKTVTDGAIDRDTLVAVSHEALSLFDGVAAGLYAAYHL
ncbi:MAG TPA: hypothetical protein VLG11_03680 [Candidatus Saccharimonadales bacterium]|nr:hypothetical protein [Candidatus Saccharimonadales bacterium]